MKSAKDIFLEFARRRGSPFAHSVLTVTTTTPFFPDIPGQHPLECVESPLR
jgi:hypothetical protein